MLRSHNEASKAGVYSVRLTWPLNPKRDAMSHEKGALDAGSALALGEALGAWELCAKPSGAACGLGSALPWLAPAPGEERLPLQRGRRAVGPGGPEGSACWAPAGPGCRHGLRETAMAGSGKGSLDSLGGTRGDAYLISI